MKINISPEIIHLYGPFGIQSYGFFIVLGIIVGILAARKNKRFKQLHLEHSYLDIVMVSVLAGCFGGRLLEVISNPAAYPHWHDWFTIWHGGFSILGSILGIITLLPLYLHKIKVPVLPLYDLACIYVPLCQSIARLGCFTAGCCYGITTNSIFAITYTNPHTLATCNTPLHPTQLYSSLFLFFIFLFMYFIAQKRFTKNGQLFCIYLSLAAFERFIVDFWRADRIMMNNFLSFHQIIALTIIGIVLMISIRTSKLKSCNKVR